MTAAGEFFTDDYLTQGLKSTNLPAPAPVSPRGFSNGSVLTENDTNLDSPGLDPRKFLLSPFIRTLDCYTGMDHLNLAEESSRTYHFGSTTCSPFEFSGYVLALTFNFLGILSPGSVFFQARVCLLSLRLVVLPLCAHQQDSATRTSYCAARRRFKTMVLASVNAWVSTYRCGLMLLTLFLWVLFVSSLMPQMTTGFPVQRIVPTPWSDGVRIGEALNPGPPFAIGTLNVASLSKHNEVVTLPYHCPLTLVITETCLTQESEPFVREKACSVHRSLVPGCLCKPRTFLSRKDSVLRGQSGGVAITSDPPCRRSSLQMAPETWLSTRIVEAILSLGPNLIVRMVGIYGFSGNYESSRLTDDLLNSMMEHVVCSSLPCFVVGDFNCPLEDLSFWTQLESRGWKDANKMAKDLLGFPLYPTWKHQTRIDYILVPPQLQGYFQSFSHTNDTISDHSFIAAEFDIPSPGIRCLKWRPCRDLHGMPEEFWTSFSEEPRNWGKFNHLLSCSELDGAMDEFTSQFESSMKNSLKHVPLPPKSFCGRSKPKLVEVPIHTPVVRHARPGDFQPALDDAPIRVRQQIRQIRRLHTVLKQLAKAADGSLGATTAALETWEAIVDSTGFQPHYRGFVWETYGIILPRHVDCSDIPLLDLLYSLQIQTLGALEYSLMKLNKSRHLAFMETDWKKGGAKHFKDIRPPPKPSITLLEVPAPVRVTRCRHDKKGPFFIVAPDFPPQALYVEHGDIRRRVISRDGTRVQLDGPIWAARAEVTITALTPTGDPGILQGMTERFWDAFWNSHPTVDLQEVTEILATLPQIPPFDAEISEKEVKQGLAKLNPVKARGPDQWSNEELRRLPPDCTLALVDLFNAVTRYGRWPSSLLHATVSMLSKTLDSFELSQTRPITILSTIYRLWSKIMSRKFLYNCLPWLPQGLQGNRPRASSKWVGTFIQMLAENALLTNTPFHVASLDLTKAYNLLHRDVLRLTNAKFGTPLAVWEVYDAFLAGLVRHFRVLGSVSPGIKSTTGCPEGDALAVYQMAQLNWLVLARLEKVQTADRDTEMVSYVDNWLYASYMYNHLRLNLDLTHEFQKAAGFKISPSKTWMSSTSAAARSVLKTWSWEGKNPEVCMSKVELGMLFRFTRSPSFAPTQTRWEQGLDRIARLVNKSWPNQGVFPMLFSGCETLHISLSNLRTIRARLNVAVMGRGSVSSHLLSPLLASSETYEPFLYIFKNRLTSLRSCLISFGEKKAVRSWNDLCHLHLPSLQHKILGPIGLFIWSCQVLLWEVISDFRVRVSDGIVLHLLATPQKVWHTCVQQAWAEYAFRQFLTKQGHPFTTVSFSVRTWKSMWARYKSLPPLSIKYRTFGLLSSSARARIQGTDTGNCELCGAQKAGHIHTVEECPALDEIRQLPKYARIPSIPRFTRCTGVPSSAFRIDDEPLQTWFPPKLIPSADVFTDGSASPTDLPNVRLSAWSTVLAHQDGTFSCLASGPSPGPFHNILRAETYAILVALRTVIRIHLFVDNSTVVNSLHRLLNVGFDPYHWVSGPDVDLWAAIAAEVITRPPQSIFVTKVKSHQDPSCAESLHERWLIAGNAQADHWAKLALSDLARCKLQWDSLAERQALQDAFLSSQFLHDLSDKVFALRKKLDKDEDIPLPQASAPSLPDPCIFQVWSFQTCTSLSDTTWDSNFLLLLQHYFTLLEWPVEARQQDPGISLLEIMLDFCITFQTRLPINVAVNRLRIPGIPVLPPKSPAKYVLLSRSLARTLPPDTFKSATHTILRAFDFLYPRIRMVPFPRENLRSLANLGYSNVVPSIKITPRLPSGAEARRLLSQTLIPGVRVLKYPFVVPRRTSASLPPGLSSDFLGS